MVIVGFGSIAQAVLPLFFRHLEIRPDQVRIISAHEDEEGIARKFGVAYEVRHLTEENYRSVLEPCLNSGDFLVNLSVDVSSLALIDLCWQRNARYLDTSTEPWEGGYTDPSLPISERSNYALRDRVLEYGLKMKEGPTAVIAHGANPGLISTFAKKALLDLARDNGVSASPSSKLEWAQLACSLGIKAIHIAERDTQNTHEYKIRDEFVNTWSVDGMISESLQPAELGWGSHERHWPEDAERHESGCGAAIYLKRPGAATRVRSWTPLEGAYHGFLITHNESISLADYFTIKDGAKVLYRPTVHYAYHPCDDAVLSLYELSGNNWQPQSAKRILRDEICDGMDELGILLMGNAKGVYWYGSRLTIQEARQLVPYNNATSLQVAAGVLAAFVWALRNPNAGIVEAEDIDHDFVLEICRPYLGELVGIYGDWTPLLNRNWPFGENMDTDDPWQFKNIRVM
jgi:homospermidine synthase